MPTSCPKPFLVFLASRLTPSPHSCSVVRMVSSWPYTVTLVDDPCILPPQFLSCCNPIFSGVSGFCQIGVYCHLCSGPFPSHVLQDWFLVPAFHYVLNFFPCFWPCNSRHLVKLSKFPSDTHGTQWDTHTHTHTQNCPCYSPVSTIFSPSSTLTLYFLYILFIQLSYSFIERKRFLLFFSNS